MILAAGGAYPNLAASIAVTSAVTAGESTAAPLSMYVHAPSGSMNAATIPVISPARACPSIFSSAAMAFELGTSLATRVTEPTVSARRVARRRVVGAEFETTSLSFDMSALRDKLQHSSERITRDI